MEYLKKTNGIDLGAKNSALRGNVTIQLKDDTTGKILEEIEHKNFFTKALDSALNGCPFGLDSYSKTSRGVAAYPDTNDYRMMPINDILLGGIMCFPNSLGDSLDDYYPSFAGNYPTAYASKKSYQITDSKQGSFDGVSSGVISNGYRFVYSWASNAGNGRIGAVALSHRDCYTYFNDAQEMFFPQCKRDGADATRGFYGDIALRTGGAFINALAMSNNTILYADLDGNLEKVKCYKMPPYNIDLNVDYYRGFDRLNDPVLWSYNVASVINFPASWQYHEGAYWAIIKNANGASAVKILKIAESDGAVTEQNITWNTPSGGNSNNSHFAVKNGYVYMPATVAGKIYKCSLTNAADVTEIECNSVANDSVYTNDYTDNIYARNFLINNDVVINHSAVNYAIGTSNGQQAIIYNHGVWILGVSQSRSYIMNAQILAPYCATKANLDSPVTKTSEKQMIINYTVTQV